MDRPTHDLRGALNAALLQIELAQRAHARQDPDRLSRSLAATREAIERAVAIVDASSPSSSS